MSTVLDSGIGGCALCFSGCLVSSAGNKIYFFESFWPKALVRCCRCYRHAISVTLFIVLMVLKSSNTLP
jgi:hypothetical protein